MRNRELVGELHGALIDLRGVLLSFPADGLTDAPELYLGQLRDAVQYATERLGEVEEEGQLHPSERREIRSVLEGIAETHHVGEADSVDDARTAHVLLDGSADRKQFDRYTTEHVVPDDGSAEWHRYVPQLDGPPYVMPLDDATDQRLRRLIWSDWAPRNLADGSNAPGAPDALGNGAEQQGEVTHSDDYRTLSWFGERYEFTANQAAVIRVLVEHWRRGAPAVGCERLLEAIDHEDPPERLDIVFRKSTAWNTIIVSGETKGTRQLQAPPQEKTK